MYVAIYVIIYTVFTWLNTAATISHLCKMTAAMHYSRMPTIKGAAFNQVNTVSVLEKYLYTILHYAGLLCINVNKYYYQVIIIPHSQ